MPANDLKTLAARQALEFVRDGMLLGLGTGSTTRIFIDLLGERVRSGELRGIRAVPTSIETAHQAEGWGITLTTLGKHPDLDLAVDGADEVDPNLDLIKGLGKALLREKIVEIHARQFVIIVDESKLVSRLGMKDALPVEIVQFEYEAHLHFLRGLGCRAELWRDEHGEPIVTDNGNYYARCWFGPQDGPLMGIPDTAGLARVLADQPGIVEHGMFLGMASQVIVAGESGIRLLEREKETWRHDP